MAEKNHQATAVSTSRQGCDKEDKLLLASLALPPLRKEEGLVTLQYTQPRKPALLPRVDRLPYLMAGRRVWALTHGFHVNTTRELGSSICPIRFENALAISRDPSGAVG